MSANSNTSSNTHDTRCDGKCWQVMRQDDHGNNLKVASKFVVDDHLSESEAEAMASDFTARGHKQMYWIERMPSAPRKQGLTVPT